MANPSLSSSSTQPNPNLSSSVTQSNTVFNFISPIKLDRSNYLMWRAQVTASIKGNRLESFINGTSKITDTYITIRTEEGANQIISNPEFIAWSAKDQMLLGWMLSSMTESILSLVMNWHTSYAVWRALDKHFGSQSKAKTVNLRYQLNTTKKHELSMADYFVKMKGIADSFACAGSAIEDSDLIMHILGGIGSDYGDVATYLTANAASMDLDEAYAMLLSKEARLERERGEINTVMTNNLEAHFAQNSYDEF